MSQSAPNLAQQLAIEIAKPLHIAPNQINTFLLVHIGDIINQDTVLAKKAGTLGLSKTQIQSPVSGKIVGIDDQKGVLYVESQADQEVERLAEEKIEEDKPKQRQVPTNSQEIPALAGFGSAAGEGFFIKDLSETSTMSSEWHGKILLFHTFPSLKLFYQASAVDVAGIIIAATDTEAETQLAKVQNKIHLGVLLFSEDVSLNLLHKRALQIDGANKILHIL
ncbi:hypothetical protein GYA49_02795 [Candidatus Beckwithbacteria bacterium]|nr:hypothetical protein [Candidatus Beckwithbacteria bacterium]